MMTSAEIRQQFLDFFKEKGHTIVPSAPLVIKNDPTLLFTNAGMNQFKDYFLGNKPAPFSRVADTQKCLRVSGKHNDLEEVGVDTYHHTMFEMLGNWSFGNSEADPKPYFKEEAIAWSWELLTKIFKIPVNNIYVSIFEGDAKEGLQRDNESFEFWKKWVPEDRIILGSKKDNFWEMGETGPCGPCTEIHVDCRSEEEKLKVSGKSLVNNDDPQVIEIWNNVFIQYNRKKDGSLEKLTARHVDTGMGFERLVRVLQNKQSNYDTDVFSGTIEEIEKISGKKYAFSDSRKDVAFRVIADHIRAISFPIIDGQLPSNTGAGYVIRRILRRAVRYYVSYLEIKEPLLYKLVPIISEQFKQVFPELHQQQDFVARVIQEEESNFLKTLGSGIKLFYDHLSERLNAYAPEVIASISKDLLVQNPMDFMHQSVNKLKELKPADTVTTILKVPGELAFKLQDTYGFPLDLTKLMAEEIGGSVDEKEFEKEMQQQKDRSRAAAVVDTEDWVSLEENGISEFVGYRQNDSESQVIKYRKTKSQGKETFQIVLDKTPFYAESGGQVGDTGVLLFGEEKIPVVNTKKENDLIIHFTTKLPQDISQRVKAEINHSRRGEIKIHHSATHLMHAALRQVLGKHVAQKGSLVNDEGLRFDFSHFAKLTSEEIEKIESIVNEKIRENIPVVIKEMEKEEALKLGAMALFGEKYGDKVRVVMMDPAYSIELCGGTHVGNTGELGYFKITHETAVGAGVRRVEALSGKAAQGYLHNELTLLSAIREQFKNPKDLQKAITTLQAENTDLKKQLEKAAAKELLVVKENLLTKLQTVNDIPFIGEIVEVSNADGLRKLSLMLKEEVANLAMVLAANIDGKAAVAILLDETIASSKNLEAPKIIKEQVAPLIKGGGGGQKTLAIAGGQDVSKLPEVIEKVKGLL
jgi:alanyl-tRNA synthetase